MKNSLADNQVELIVRVPSMRVSFLVDRYSAHISENNVVTYRMAGRPEGRTISLRKDLLDKHLFGINSCFYEGDCVMSNGNWMQGTRPRGELIT